MPRDFTLKIYEKLLQAAIKNGYAIISYENYVANATNHRKTFILRHDVDKLPQNALQIALLQSRLGVKGSYYFRIVKESFNEAVIKKIAALGHEIGYHYEDLALCKGNVEKAFVHFQNGLEKMRRFYPVKTICMHGSPLSKWDNRLLWKKYDYRDFGIIAEPYFDTDFQKVFYLTDTGRRWDGSEVSVRDKVNSAFALKLASTWDIIAAIQRQELPDQVMQTIHPQRWTNQSAAWLQELVSQNTKNVVKNFLIRVRRS